MGQHADPLAKHGNLLLDARKRNAVRGGFDRTRASLAPDVRGGGGHYRR
jgi:hypothetical protein